MLTEKIRSKLAKDEDAGALVRRLLTEQALGQWKNYAMAFALTFFYYRNRKRLYEERKNLKNAFELPPKSF